MALVSAVWKRSGAVLPRHILSVLSPSVDCCVAPARRAGGRRSCAGVAAAALPNAPAANSLSAAFASRIALGNFEADTSQERAVELLSVGLTRAAVAACERSGQTGPESWVKPTRTLGTAEAAAAAGDNERVVDGVARMAAENRKRIRKQRAAERKLRAAGGAASEAEVAATAPGSEGKPAEDEVSPSSASATALAAGTDSEKAVTAAANRPSRQSVYMHGPVGTGKTMLLDLFFEQTREAKLRVVRQHFYEFMISLHEKIHEIQEEQPVEVAANKIADEVDVLCFDEFQVTDIQDAVILPRLFEVLFLRGVVIIMTSNTSPQLLYSGGLNRHVHLPAFIGLLIDYCNVLRLGGPTTKGAVDYRRRAESLEMAEAGASSDGSSKQLGSEDGYLCGIDADARLRARWLELIEGASAPAPEELRLPMGRRLQVAEATAEACFVNFVELCGTDRGEAEFLALAKRFSTIALEGVPLFASLEANNEVKRFVKLLDVLYDRRVRLVVAAAASIDELFAGIRRDVQQGDIMWRTAQFSADGKAGMAPGAVGTLCEAIQATERAESRLREMRTRRYMKECQQRCQE